MVEQVISWLGAVDFVLGRVPQEGAAALLVDLADPRLASVPPLAPNSADLADAAGAIAGPRTHFLARRALLRRLVGLRLGVPREDVVIAHDEGGRPVVSVPRRDLFVSVSSRGRLAALACAEAPVGIDIEPLGEPREPVWDVLHPRERGGIQSAWRQGSDVPFLSLWTAKEAYLKAIGLGLKRSPARIDVRFETAETFRVHDPDEQGRADPAGTCCLATLPAAQVICSVIVLGN